MFTLELILCNTNTKVYSKLLSNWVIPLDTCTFMLSSIYQLCTCKHSQVTSLLLQAEKRFQCVCSETQCNIKTFLKNPDQVNWNTFYLILNQDWLKGTVRPWQRFCTHSSLHWKWMINILSKFSSCSTKSSTWSNKKNTQKKQHPRSWRIVHLSSLSVPFL